MIFSRINNKRFLIISFIASLILGAFAKFLYLDKNHLTLFPAEINFVEISLGNNMDTFNSKKYVCSDSSKDSFVEVLNKLEKDNLPKNKFLIGTISFNLKSSKNFSGQIFTLRNKIFLKVGEMVYSGSADLNEYFKELKLIFNKFSMEEVKTILLLIEKSEVNPYFVDGGVFGPIEGKLDQILEELKKSKLHPSWLLMHYGKFILELKSGEKYEDTLLHYQDNLFFVFGEEFYYVNNKILESFGTNKGR